MKVLMFNHHPDVLHYAYRAFVELGHEVELASEAMTLNAGFRYSSTKSYKFEVVDQLYKPEDLFPDMAGCKFVKDDKNLQGYDLYWSMLPEICSLSRYGFKTWFDAQMQAFLRNPNCATLPGIKTSNHPDSAQFGFTWLPNWVDKQPPVVERRYITQLITELDKVPFTKELLEIKARKPDQVKICGGSRCPDGFVKDTAILPYTAMLVHGKQFGINCYAVCKALDMGIPVYTSKATKTLIGFDDLPDELFLFSDDMDIENAYAWALNMDHEMVQDIYRSIYTLDRTVKAAEKILANSIPL